MLERDLLVALRNILASRREGINEFELIRLLQSEPFQLLDEQALRSDLAMFQCHFLLFHCLYKLQQCWLDEKRFYLSIHVTEIRCHPYEKDQPVEPDTGLAEYYLNWDNFVSTSRDDVVQLLNSFWQKMGRMKHLDEEDKNNALSLLELSEPLTMSALKSRYRSLMHQYHPDKGGSVEQAQEIDWAYRVLKESNRSI